MAKKPGTGRKGKPKVDPFSLRIATGVLNSKRKTGKSGIQQNATLAHGQTFGSGYVEYGSIKLESAQAIAEALQLIDEDSNAIIQDAAITLRTVARDPLLRHPKFLDLRARVTFLAQKEGRNSRFTGVQFDSVLRLRRSWFSSPLTPFLLTRFGNST